MAMLAPTDDIVIRPFREVVEKGGEAVTNAEDAADNEPEASAWLYQSGQSLVKEGERAIKRLRPLMKDRTPEFYSAVKDLLAQNSEYNQDSRHARQIDGSGRCVPSRDIVEDEDQGPQTAVLGAQNPPAAPADGLR